MPASQPTQETATRPLAIQKNGTWYTYGWDLTKNICETYRTDARIDLAYTYTPYGEVSPAHAYDQPLRWSSEYHDVELGLVYYNYRHYNPVMGRWMGRDLYTVQSSASPYTFVLNTPISLWDALGLISPINNRDFEFNESSCSLKLVLHIYFDFVTEAIYTGRNQDQGHFHYQGSTWEEGRKIQYKSAFLNHINQKWNTGYRATLLNKKNMPCCPCQTQCGNGIELTMEAIEDAWYTRAEIIVTAPSYAAEPEKGHKFSEYRSQATGGALLLAEKKHTDGRSINHEIGHALGLQHPGFNYKPLNSDAEYRYQGIDFFGHNVDGLHDLMGMGDNLRPYYFGLWVEYLNKNLSSCAKRNECEYSITDTIND